jgi:hypothetical protein
MLAPRPAAAGPAERRAGRGGWSRPGLPRDRACRPPANGVEHCETDAELGRGRDRAAELRDGVRAVQGIRVNATGLAPPTERGDRSKFDAKGFDPRDHSPRVHAPPPRTTLTSAPPGAPKICVTPRREILFGMTAVARPPHPALRPEEESEEAIAVSNRIGSRTSVRVAPPPGSDSPSRKRGAVADNRPGRCWAICPTAPSIMDRVTPRLPPGASGPSWSAQTSVVESPHPPLAPRRPLRRALPAEGGSRRSAAALRARRCEQPRGEGHLGCPSAEQGENGHDARVSPEVSYTPSTSHSCSRGSSCRCGR